LALKLVYILATSKLHSWISWLWGQRSTFSPQIYVTIGPQCTLYLYTVGPDAFEEERSTLHYTYISDHWPSH